MLDLYKLRLFATVAESQSISKAAEANYMSQSAMSQHIATLEAYLGRTLLVRNRRGVSLTRDGQQLYEYAVQILALVAEAELTLVNITADSEGELAIGATPGISTYRLPNWTQSFTAGYPRLKVRLQTAITGDIVGDLLLGKLDLALLEGEIHPDLHHRLNIRHLEAISHTVIVGKHHAWWGREHITLAEIGEYKLIMRPMNSQSRQWLEGIFKHYGIKPDISLEVDNMESIKRMVMQTDNITILPHYAIEGEIADHSLWAIPVSDVSLVRDHKVVWCASRLPTPIANLFLGHLGAIFDKALVKI